jgi:signal transduction histidine kinase/CheY-like chemotaxis protein
VTSVSSTVRYTKAFLQDRSGAICLYSRNAFDLRIGDGVQVVGKVADYRGTPEVVADAVNVLRHNQTVLPADMTLERALRPTNLSRLVHIEGRVIDVRVEEDDTYLSLAAQPVPVMLRVPALLRSKDWRAGAIVAVTGVVGVREVSGIRIWEIIPQSSDSVSVMKAGSALNAQSLLILAAVLAGVLTLSGLWLLILRMRVRAATRDLVAQSRQLQETLRRLEEAHDVAHMRTWDFDVTSESIYLVPQLYLTVGGGASIAAVPFGDGLRIVHPDDRNELAASMDGAVLEGKPFAMDVRVAVPPGSERTIYMRARPVRNAEDKVVRVLGVSQDVTEQRAHQRAGEQAQRMTTVGTLAASLAHEFNNVLMSIQGLTETLARRSTDDTVLSLTQRIKSSIARGKAVSERVLRFTRPAVPIKEAIDVREWMSALRPELSQLLGDNIEVEVVVPESPEDALWISADPDQLSQAFMTLATNAREAMPNGGVFRISAHPVVSGLSYPVVGLLTPDRFVHFVIGDTGCGMDFVNLQKAFEPLYTTKRNGTGLGLPVVRHIVNLHSGHIYIESTPGQGTQIHIFIEGDTPPQLYPVADVPRIKHAISVLLVEDEPAIAEAISILLQEEGMEVVAKNTGSGALAAIEEWRPDLAILDIGLPDMNGLEVYGRIRTRWPDVPILLSTGHGQSVEEPSSSGHVILLRKPYTMDELLRAIESAVEARAA